MDFIQSTHKYLNDFEEFRKSEEFIFYLYLKESRLIYSVFTENYQSLIKSFNYHNHPRFDDINWESKANLRWKLQRHFIKDLSNYLSSIFWVVDYSRSTTQGYLQLRSEILREYEEELKAKFIDDLPHQFIQGLRNFINHKVYLKITSIKMVTRENPIIERSIYVSRQQLLDSSFQWTSKARTFILNQDEKIFLIDILKMHNKRFRDFQNDTYRKILTANIDLTQQLIVRLEEFINRAMELKATHILPFSEANVRYLKYIIK